MVAAPLVDLIVALVAGGGTLASIIQLFTGPRAEKRERARLTVEVLGDTSEPSVAPDNNETKSGSEKSQSDTPSQDVQTPQAEFVEKTESTYDRLLINDYALGLTQARRAFNVSMFFSILGGLVLIAGVSLGIFRADTGAQVAGAIITSAAGVLTTGLSQLFRGQSTKALKHLEIQASELRKDVRAQTNLRKSLSLLEMVDDEDLHARLQAALVLKLSEAELPNIAANLKPRSGVNGNRQGKVPAHKADAQGQESEIP